MDVCSYKNAIQSGPEGPNGQSSPGHLRLAVHCQQGLESQLRFNFFAPPDGEQLPQGFWRNHRGLLLRTNPRLSPDTIG
jgi:hypothetical protein